jgi:hypothetical protein
MSKGLETAVMATVAVLILLVEHWWPGKLAMSKAHPVVNYILGVAALTGPITLLFWMWCDWPAMVALWVVVISGGAATMSAYALDAWISMRSRAKIAEDEAAMLRPDDGKTD